MLGVKILIAFLIPLLLGYVIIKSSLFHKSSFPNSLVLGLSYALGAGLLSQWMLFLSTINWTYSYLSIAVPMILIIILFGLYLFKTKQLTIEPMQGPFVLSRPMLLPAIFVLYFTCIIFWFALNEPMYLWDALNLHAYKAKVFFFTNSLECLPNFPYPGYPLHISFQLFWLALNLETWDEQILKILFPVNYLMFMCVSFGFLRMFVNKHWAWIGLALLSASSIFTIHARIAYSDFMLMFYNCSTIMFLILWSKEKNDRLLILASIFAGLTSFTKLEGIGFSVIYGLMIIYILVLNKEFNLFDKIKKLLKFCIPVGIIYSHYLFYKILHFPPTEVSSGKMLMETSFAWPEFERIGLLSQKFLENIFLTNNWSVLWFVLFILVVLKLKAWRHSKGSKESSILILSIILMSGLYFVGLLFTDRFVYVANDSVLSRGLLAFFPLIVYCIVFKASSDQRQDQWLTAKGWLVLFAHWLVSFLIIIAAIYPLLNTTYLSGIGTELLYSLYSKPSMNIFLIGTDGGLNVYVLLYACFILSVCLMALTVKIFHTRFSILDNISEENLIQNNIWILLTIALTMQFFAHTGYAQWKINHHMNQEDFYEHVYGYRYTFIRNIEPMITDQASVAVNFESKIEDDPKDFTKILFNYFIYPKADLRHVCSGQPPFDYVIITDKRPAHDSTLKNYQQIYNEKELRLFKKK